MWRCTLVGGLAVALAALPLRGADNRSEAEWPQFRGPNRDDLSPDKGLMKHWPSDGPPLAWSAKNLGGGFSGVSVVVGRIFTMGDRSDASYVIALDAKDGRELWSAKVGEPGQPGGYEGTRCTPTLDGELLYALGQFGDLVCLETATGKERWRKSFPKDFNGQVGSWGYCESPLVEKEKLLCTPGGKDATIVALDKKTGEVIWKCAIPGGDRAEYSSIVLTDAGGTRQCVQLMGGGVVGVALKDGKFLWKYDKLGRNTANVPTCIVHDDLVFCTAGYKKGGALLKLVPSGGGVKAEEQYYAPDLRNRHGGVVLVNDHLYGDQDQNGVPFCAEFKTGKIVWQRKDSDGPGRGSASVTYADGDLYFRFDNGYVALVEATPTAYKEISTFKIQNSTRQSWSHPVVVGGRLYLREKDTLWCYNVKQS